MIEIDEICSFELQQLCTILGVPVKDEGNNEMKGDMSVTVEHLKCHPLFIQLSHTKFKDLQNGLSVTPRYIDKLRRPLR